MNLATLAQRQAERYRDRLLALVNDEAVTYAAWPRRRSGLPPGSRPSASNPATASR